MTKTEFDTSLQTLLQAFAAHQDLRAAHADVRTLARSNYDLYVARMAAYHASR